MLIQLLKNKDTQKVYFIIKRYVKINTMIEILVHPKLKQELVDEFKTSMQTVNMALKYVYNSDLSKSIRLKAKELMIEQIELIDKHEQRND